jgi:hypothetical protein
MKVIFLLSILRIVVRINGLSEYIFTTTECFQHNARQCNHFSPRGANCTVYTNPVLCEHNSSCYSYDAPIPSNVRISEIKAYLNLTLKCTDIFYRIVVTNASFHFTKPEINICENKGCTGLNMRDCRLLDCVCLPVNTLDTCKQSVPELIEEVNKQCQINRGQCSVKVARRKIPSCDRTASCTSTLDQRFSFCYAQYVQIKYKCIGKLTRLLL